MNQNPVKLLWGLWACQPPPSILIAPGRCNSACSPYCSQESKPHARGGWVLPLGTMCSTGWYGESASVEQRRWRRAAEGPLAVRALECVCQVTELDTCSPLRPFPGLIDSLPSGHSFLFEELWQRLCLSLLGSRTKGASRSAGERKKPQRAECPLHQEPGAPSCLSSLIIALTDLAPICGSREYRVLIEHMSEEKLAEEAGLSSIKHTLTHSRFCHPGFSLLPLILSFVEHSAHYEVNQLKPSVWISSVN